MTNGQQPSQQQTTQAAHSYGLHQDYQNLQTQQQVTSQADQRASTQATDSWLMRPFAPLLKRLAEDKAKTQYNDKLPNEARSLRQGLTTRSAPGFQPANYLGFSHPQLHQMVSQGVDAGTVGEVGDTWLEMGDDLTSFQDDFARALASSETSWTGTNADAARRSVAELGNAGGAIGQAAQLTGVVTHQQSQALATAKNSMPPPPAHPFNAQAAQQQLQTITDPVALATQAAADHAAAAQQQQAHQQAATVVCEFDTTVAQTSATMPAFAPAPQVVHSPAGPNQPTGAPGTGAPRSHQSGGYSTYRAPSTGSGGNSPATGLPSRGAPGTSAPSGATQPGSSGQTTSSGYGGPPPVATPTGPSLPSSGPSLPGSGGNPSGGMGGGFIPQVGGASGGWGPSGGVDSGFGPAGSGGSGSNPAGGSGPEAGGTGGRSGTGSRSGTGAVDEATTEGGQASGRGMAGERSGSTMGGGTRGGKGQEDAEHKRPSYLLESDPDSIFGTDEKTAPPVIGE